MMHLLIHEGIKIRKRRKLKRRIKEEE